MFNGSASCNNATFGDPIPGVVKQCAIGPQDFTHCADEGAQCNFSGTKIVAYGGNGSFIYRVRTGNFSDPGRREGLLPTKLNLDRTRRSHGLHSSVPASRATS
jgi:hypothetical protein